MIFVLGDEEATERKGIGSEVEIEGSGIRESVAK